MKQSPLVLEGREIKLRLQAEQLANPAYVHIDWLRFTVYRRFAPLPSVDLLFPKPQKGSNTYKQSDYFKLHRDEDADEKEHLARVSQRIAEFANADYMACGQAYELGCEVVEILGPDFTIDQEFRKGKDFYRFRYDILRKGHAVGWVGFLSTSEGQKGADQSNTLHVNLEGMACTFAQSGWRDHMADLIDKRRALITRIDQAIDFFDGIEGGIERFPDEYKKGLMDHCYQRPAHQRVGTWDCDDVSLNKGRSFYVGTRATGKFTDIYEKGLQLFGAESFNPWIRFELRWGNQKRVLPSDMLRRPADFFAGASEWHSSIMREYGARALPENVPCEARLQIQTLEAETERNARWLIRTAGASVRFALQFLDLKTLDTLIEDESRIPNRLRKFSLSEVERCYSKVFKRVGHMGRANTAFA